MRYSASDSAARWAAAADRIKANYCVIIAPQEYENNQVSIKDLKQKEQTTVNLGSDLLAWAQQTKTQTCFFQTYFLWSCKAATVGLIVVMRFVLGLLRLL